MLRRIFRLPSPSQPETTAPVVATVAPPRRAATAMEYMFVISLILLALLTGVGYFGQQTKDLMQKNSDSVNNATQQNR